MASGKVFSGLSRPPEGRRRIGGVERSEIQVYREHV